VEQNDVTGSRSGSEERELAGAGSMGSYGSGAGTGYDTDPASTGASTSDPYGTGDATTTYSEGTTGTRDRDA
jgi:hypothetical protein